MGIFKKKNYNPFEDKGDKKKNKSGCKTNALSVFIILVIIVISMSFYFISYDNSQLNSLTNYTKFINVDEKNLNLTYSSSNTDVYILKNKLSHAGLVNLSQNISPLTINSSSNAPCRDLILIFQEIAYLSNVVISATNPINILELYWELDNENKKCVVYATYKYYYSPNQDSQLTYFYLNHIFEFDIENKTSTDISLALINGNSTLHFKEKDTLYSLRVALCSFLFENKVKENDNESYNEENANDNQNYVQNKTLCEMLGFSSLEINQSGIDYFV